MLNKERLVERLPEYSKLEPRLQYMSREELIQIVKGLWCKYNDLVTEVNIDEIRLQKLIEDTANLLDKQEKSK